MNDQKSTTVAAAPTADDSAYGADAGLQGAASFADAESREILNLLGDADAGSCCGGSCCAV